MRDYVHWATLGALCEFLPARPTTGSPSPTRPTGTACPSRTSPTPKCDNDQQLMRGRARRRWRPSCTPPAPRRSSPSTGTPTSSAAPGWPPDAEDGVVDADHRVFGVPNLLRRRRQRAAHPGRRQPGADHHGAGRPRRRPAGHPAGPRRRTDPGGCAMTAPATPIDAVTVAVYRFPTAGTGGRRHPDAGTPPPRSPPPCTPASGTGLGWTYSTAAAAAGDHTTTSPRRVTGRDADRHRRLLVGDAPGLPQPRHPRPGHAGHQRRRHRPVGPQGPAARRARWPTLFGRCRDAVPVYGSGGFTTLTDAQLADQVDGWAGGRLHRDEDQDRRVLGHRHRPRPRPGRHGCATWPAPASS